jgi:hypothetical protein
MNSKIILATVAMTFVAGLAAHADAYRRPQRPVPQVQEQDFDDEDLDEEYYRPRGERQPPPRQEFYCPQPRCQAPRILPYPNAPIFVPVPLPRPISGACTVVPRQYGGHWGWAILVNNQIEVARGLRQDSPNVPYLRQQLMANGICQVFLN